VGEEEADQLDIAAIASCDNVVAKLGGLAMPDNGFGWNTADFTAAERTAMFSGTARCVYRLV
jgi:hypothetical protein